MWENVGMARDEARLKQAIEAIRSLKQEFWKEVYVPGSLTGVNDELLKANRLADYLELAELIAHDALLRNESCGCHFRVEYQSEDGEALRNDEEYKYVSCWEYQGEGVEPQLHKEPLEYEFVELKSRNYKV